MMSLQDEHLPPAYVWNHKEKALILGALNLQNLQFYFVKHVALLRASEEEILGITLSNIPIWEVKR